MPTLAFNKRLRYDYSVIEEYEAGIVLTGAEVKACKLGHVQLIGCYVVYEDNEFWLTNAMISPYQMNNQRMYDPLRRRKLLMKRSEITTLLGKRQQQGLTLLVESLYTTRGLIKVKVVLARGKKKFDKRESIKKRDVDRNLARAMRKKI